MKPKKSKQQHEKPSPNNKPHGEEEKQIFMQSKTYN